MSCSVQRDIIVGPGSHKMGRLDRASFVSSEQKSRLPWVAAGGHNSPDCNPGNWQSYISPTLPCESIELIQFLSTVPAVQPRQSKPSGAVRVAYIRLLIPLIALSESLLLSSLAAAKAAACLLFFHSVYIPERCWQPYPASFTADPLNTTQHTIPMIIPNLRQLWKTDYVLGAKSLP